MSGGTSHRDGWEIDDGSFALQTLLLQRILAHPNEPSLLRRTAEPQSIRLGGGWINTSSVTTEAKG